MPIEGMNHFNVLTDDVEATRHFYCDILGLEKGERPPFKFDGLWLSPEDGRSSTCPKRGCRASGRA